MNKGDVPCSKTRAHIPDGRVKSIGINQTVRLSNFRKGNDDKMTSILKKNSKHK